jgi:hypothetical protein
MGHGLGALRPSARVGTVAVEAAMAPTPDERVRERELERRLENELKDLDTENTHGERPLEGLSSAPMTTWTDEQDDAQRAVHEDDERKSHERSLADLVRAALASHPERARED